VQNCDDKLDLLRPFLLKVLEFSCSTNPLFKTIKPNIFKSGFCICLGESFMGQDIDLLAYFHTFISPFLRQIPDHGYVIGLQGLSIK